MRRLKKIRYFVVIMILIGTLFLFGSQSDPEKLAPPSEDKIVGKAYYLSPIDSNALSDEGLYLDKGWNTITWSEDKNVGLGEGLESIKEDYYYVYEYSKKNFFLILLKSMQHIMNTHITKKDYFLNFKQVGRMGFI
jgi:hypothetical protein